MPHEIAMSDWILSPLFPAEAMLIPVRLGANLSMRRGTVLGELEGSSGTYSPYGASNADGTNVARLILQIDCSTDENGYITLGSLVINQGLSADRKYEKAKAFMTGTFRTEDLVGLDATAVDQLGRLIQGTVQQGTLRVE